MVFTDDNGHSDVIINHHTSDSIKILQLRLAKSVTLQTYTNLSPVPHSSKLFFYKQLIQIVKQSWPHRVPKSIVQVQQRPLASPTVPSTTASPFDPFKSLALLHTPLQAHYIKWIQASICCYNKKFQSAI